MAQRRSSARSGARATSRKRASRTAEAPAAEQEEGGLDFEAGIGIVTTIVLIAAMLMLDYHAGTNLGAGFFFKG